MDDENAIELSSANRNYIVTLVFFGLLLFGPVEPYGMGVRTAYLVAVPIAFWLALPFVGRRLRFDTNTNDHINRALSASLAGALLVGAYLSLTAPYHSECTQYARDGDGGRECVGDTVIRSGPDKGEALMLVLFAGVAFWVSVARRTD